MATEKKVNKLSVANLTSDDSLLVISLPLLIKDIIILTKVLSYCNGNYLTKSMFCFQLSS